MDGQATICSPKANLLHRAPVYVTRCRQSSLGVRLYAPRISLCLSVLSSEGCIFISRDSLMAKSRYSVLCLCLLLGHLFHHLLHHIGTAQVTGFAFRLFPCQGRGIQDDIDYAR